MLTWSELFIGLIPFALAGVLLWLRLIAAGAKKETAAKLIIALSAILAFVLIGIALAAKGWRERNFAVLFCGAALGICSLIALRKKLVKVWEKFPLTEKEGEPKD